VEPGSGVLLLLGSERGGLPDLGAAMHRVAVRQAAFDSLNVAMAATILLYELASVAGGADGSGEVGVSGQR
jgi:tRNA G18 (ribose-2'-O)-methylase SpoU